jgi:ribosomal protein L11 methyltransferase
MPATYIEVEITGDPALFENLIALLGDKGYDGFWEEESRLRGYIRSGQWNRDKMAELETIATSLARNLALPPATITTRLIEDQNWNALWEASITPVQVSDHIVVAPTWHPYPATPGMIVLTIDPKMSFGTGHHETTRLMMRLLERHIKAGDRMLDVGTGTGILAIAGVKLGAASAMGLDNDEWSYANARENVNLNLASGQVSVVLGEITALPADRFDLIAANIQRNVIEQILSEMTGRMNPGGRLLLSGLLESDRLPIRDALARQGLEILEELGEKEWAAFATARTEQ